MKKRSLSRWLLRMPFGVSVAELWLATTQRMRNRRTLSRRPGRMPMVAAAAAFWLAGAPVLTGCSLESDDDIVTEENVYCVAEDGTIIDMEYCDDQGYYNGYPTWIWLTTSHHNAGYRVPSSHRSAMVRSNDPAARANAGLPRTGRPSATVRHSGGFGSGQVGRGSGGGSNHGVGGGSHSSGGG